VADERLLYFAASFALFGLVLLEWVALRRPQWVTARILRGTRLLFLALQGAALICSIIKFGPLAMAHSWPSTMLVVEGALALCLLMERTTAKPTGAAAVVATLAFVAHSYTLLLGTPPTEALQISPFARSIWYAVYVASALAACSAYLNAGGGAIASAISGLSHAANTGPEKPAPPDAFAFSRTPLVLAFPLLSASLIAWALWTHLIWGSYWTWRPAGLWVLVLWLILGTTLHIRTSERRLRWAFAALAILGCALALFGLPLLGSGLTAVW
jgi:hypothetical protein